MLQARIIRLENQLASLFRRATLNGFVQCAWCSEAKEYAKFLVEEAQQCLERFQRPNNCTALSLQERWSTGFSIVKDIIRELDSPFTRSAAELDLLQLKFFEYEHYLLFMFRGRLAGDYFHNVGWVALYSKPCYLGASNDKEL